MKKELFFLSSIALMTLASCSSDENDPMPGNPSNEIRVATEVTTPQSRAGYTTETLREFGLIIASGNDAFTYNNKRMIGGPLEGWSTDQTMYWAGTDQAHTVIAYAPYREATLDSQSKIDVKVATDQSTAEAVTASDFIAMKNGAFTPSSHLTEGKLLVKMDHILTKVFVKLTYPEAYASADGTNPVTGMTVEGMKVDATFDFGAWDGSATSAALALNGNGAIEAISPFALSHDAANRVVTYEFIAIPQEQASIGIKFNAGGTPYTWTYDNLKQNSGEALTITLSVDKQGVQLGGDVTVGEWNVGGEINGGQPSEGADPYTIEEITTEKSNWSIVYGTPSIYGKYQFLFDLDNGPANGFTSHLKDGWNGSPNIGNPFFVVDMKKTTWISSVGFMNSWADVVPQKVEFYVSDASIEYTMGSDIEEYILGREPYAKTDTWISSQSGTDYINTIKAIDAGIEWEYIGSADATPDGLRTEQAVWNNLSETELAKEHKGRYLKVVLVPYPSTTTQADGIGFGDRVKITELFVKKVSKHNGVAVD